MRGGEVLCEARDVLLRNEALGARLRLREVDSEFALYALEALELREALGDVLDGLHGAACALAHEVEAVTHGGQRVRRRRDLGQPLAVLLRRAVCLAELLGSTGKVARHRPQSPAQLLRRDEPSTEALAELLGRLRHALVSHRDLEHLALDLRQRGRDLFHLDLCARVKGDLQRAAEEFYSHATPSLASACGSRRRSAARRPVRGGRGGTPPRRARSGSAP